MRRILIIRGHVRFFFFLTLATHAFGAGIGSYSHLVVGDSAGAVRRRRASDLFRYERLPIRIQRHALLVDPYFSRVDLLSVALGSRIQPNAARINDGLRHLATKADAILVTHGHFDHLLDVPAVMAKTRARLIASASSVDLASTRGSFIRRRSKTRRRAANRSMENSRVIRDTRSAVRQSAI